MTYIPPPGLEFEKLNENVAQGIKVSEAQQRALKWIYKESEFYLGKAGQAGDGFGHSYPSLVKKGLMRKHKVLWDIYILTEKGIEVAKELASV